MVLGKAANIIMSNDRMKRKNCRRVNGGLRTYLQLEVIRNRQDRAQNAGSCRKAKKVVRQTKLEMWEGNKKYYYLSTFNSDGRGSAYAVSYTHLDVYKRQERQCGSHIQYTYE